VEKPDLSLEQLMACWFRGHNHYTHLPSAESTKTPGQHKRALLHTATRAHAVLLPLYCLQVMTTVYGPGLCNSLTLTVKHLLSVKHSYW